MADDTRKELKKVMEGLKSEFTSNQKELDEVTRSTEWDLRTKDQKKLNKNSCVLS